MKLPAFLFVATILLAQPSSPPSVIYVTSDPAGACAASAQLRFNTANGKLWGCNALTWGQIGGGGGGTPASPTNSIQFNSAGSFGGNSALLWSVSGIPQQVYRTGSNDNQGRTNGIVRPTGTYTGTTAATFHLEIDNDAATPATYKWQKNGGAFTTGVNTATTPHLLSDGVSVTFLTTTGFSNGDAWDFKTDERVLMHQFTATAQGTGDTQASSLVWSSPCNVGELSIGTTDCFGSGSTYAGKSGSNGSVFEDTGVLFAVKNDKVFTEVEFISALSGGPYLEIDYAAARGTIATPLGLQNGDVIADHYFWGMVPDDGSGNPGMTIGMVNDYVVDVSPVGKSYIPVRWNVYDENFNNIRLAVSSSTAGGFASVGCHPSISATWSIENNCNSISSGHTTGVVIAGPGDAATDKLLRGLLNDGTTEKWSITRDGFLNQVGATFANLGSPANGTQILCSDCTVTSGSDDTCAGSGSG